MTDKEQKELRDRANKLHSELYGARTREDSIRLIQETLVDIFKSTRTKTKREFTLVENKESAC